MEPRFRRVQRGAPLSGRGLPGMPLEMEDPDGDDPGARHRERFGDPAHPWWRPTGKLGRIVIAVAALSAAAAFAFAVHASKAFLERDSRFRISGSSNIQATGLAEITRADLLPVFGEDIGRNIFFVPLAQRRKQLEQLPWVQRATVMRLLPNQIHVSVVERQPVAFVRHAQQIGLVDADGVLLDMPVAMMAQHHYSFPVLTGIDARDSLPLRKARVDLYLRLMHDLDANGQHNSEQISEIDLTDPEDARVLMPEQGTDILAHFGEGHFLERYQRYKAHIAEWRQQYPHLAEVDLRYDRQVVLEMAPGAAADSAAVNTADAKPVAGEPAKAPSNAEAAKSKAPSHGVSRKAAKPHTSAHARALARRHAEQVKARRRAEARRAALRRIHEREAKRNHAAGTSVGQGR